GQGRRRSGRTGRSRPGSRTRAGRGPREKVAARGVRKRVCKTRTRTREIALARSFDCRTVGDESRKRGAQEVSMLTARWRPRARASAPHGERDVESRGRKPPCCSTKPSASSPRWCDSSCEAHTPVLRYALPRGGCPMRVRGFIAVVTVAVVGAFATECG